MSVASSLERRHPSLLAFRSPVRADAGEDSQITNVRDHSDTWLRSEWRPSSAELRSSAGGVAACRGRGRLPGAWPQGRRARKKVSWRPPCWDQFPVQGRWVWLACSVADRLGIHGNVCGACRGSRQSGAAWLQPAGQASPIPTSTAWSC